MKQTNPQVEQMISFIVMDVLERANELQKQGIDIIHLEVGEPDFDVPACVAEAAKKAYDSHLTHYTHSLGDPELRKEIAAFHQQEYGVTVDPDCVVVTSGSSPAILLVLLLLCRPDSEVILSNPGYACYRNFVLAAQAKPVLVPLRPENGLQYRRYQKVYHDPYGSYFHQFSDESYRTFIGRSFFERDCRAWSSCDFG